MLIKLREIIEQQATDKNISNQQALKDVIGRLQAVCHELGLDFDLALDKADDSEGQIPDNCDHQLGYPCAGGSIYCPKCRDYIVKGKPEEIKEMQEQYRNWVKGNLWRPFQNENL